MVVTPMHSSSDSSACVCRIKVNGMSSAQAPFPEPIYATSSEPRELTSEDLAFISKYTGRPAETLRRHILDVWNSAKKQVDPAHLLFYHLDAVPCTGDAACRHAYVAAL